MGTVRWHGMIFRWGGAWLMYFGIPRTASADGPRALHGARSVSVRVVGRSRPGTCQPGSARLASGRFSGDDDNGGNLILTFRESVSASTSQSHQVSRAWSERGCVVVHIPSDRIRSLHWGAGLGWGQVRRRRYLHVPQHLSAHSSCCISVGGWESDQVWMWGP